uniref:(northern house mosquito) hypothetical protein n=1 Tax=Culex pipiens TaxID=7175 RepID=A0A8D8HVQ8_CULPI
MIVPRDSSGRHQPVKREKKKILHLDWQKAEVEPSQRPHSGGSSLVELADTIYDGQLTKHVKIDRHRGALASFLILFRRKAEPHRRFANVSGVCLLSDNFAL